MTPVGTGYLDILSFWGPGCWGLQNTSMVLAGVGGYGESLTTVMDYSFLFNSISDRAASEREAHKYGC